MKKIGFWIFVIIVCVGIIYWLFGGMSFNQGDGIVDTSENQLKEALDLLH